MTGSAMAGLTKVAVESFDPNIVYCLSRIDHHNIDPASRLRHQMASNAKKLAEQLRLQLTDTHLKVSTPAPAETTNHLNPHGNKRIVSVQGTNDTMYTMDIDRYGPIMLGRFENRCDNKTPTPYYQYSSTAPVYELRDQDTIPSSAIKISENGFAHGSSQVLRVDGVDQVVLGGAPGEVTLVNTASGESRGLRDSYNREIHAFFPSGCGELTASAASTDGKTLYCGFFNRIVLAIDIARWEIIGRYCIDGLPDETCGSITAMACNGDRLFVADGSSIVSVILPAINADFDSNSVACGYPLRIIVLRPEDDDLDLHVTGQGVSSYDNICEINLEHNLSFEYTTYVSDSEDEDEGDTKPLAPRVTAIGHFTCGTVLVIFDLNTRKVIDVIEFAPASVEVCEPPVDPRYGYPQYGMLPPLYDATKPRPKIGGVESRLCEGHPVTENLSKVRFFRKTTITDPSKYSTSKNPSHSERFFFLIPMQNGEIMTLKSFTFGPDCHKRPDPNIPHIHSYECEVIGAWCTIPPCGATLDIVGIHIVDRVLDAPEKPQEIDEHGREVVYSSHRKISPYVTVVFAETLSRAHPRSGSSNIVVKTFDTHVANMYQLQDSQGAKIAYLKASNAQFEVDVIEVKDRRIREAKEKKEREIREAKETEERRKRKEEEAKALAKAKKEEKEHLLVHDPEAYFAKYTSGSIGTCFDDQKPSRTDRTYDSYGDFY